MFKKILSLALVAMLLMSFAVIGVSAAEADVADQGAEADVAATGADGTIYFDAASAGWEDASSVLFYIYDLDNGTELAPWGSKKKLGGTKGDNNIWSFDAAGLGVASGGTYFIIFNNYDSNAETYQLMMDASCFGDTAKANPGNLIENPVDSNKKSMEARWTSSSLGPRLAITSVGSIVGETIPGNTTAYKMFVNFLASKGKDGLTNALNFNGKDAQTTIDEIAGKLGLNKADVTKAIEEAKTTGNGTDTCDWSDKWDASKSSLAEGSSSDSTTSSNSSTGTTTTTTGGSSSTTKSGSASNTQTGQESTVLFIMLGVMVAAAGVIFFLRRKERA